MSEHKFTPGPWHWVNSMTDEPFDFEAQWDGFGYPDLRTVDVFGENKTEVRDGGTYTSFALPKFILTADSFSGDGTTNKANARLIAAAPELLEALKTARQALLELNRAHTDPNWFTHGKRGADQHYITWERKAANAIHTALAKATEES